MRACQTPNHQLYPQTLPHSYPLPPPHPTPLPPPPCRLNRRPHHAATWVQHGGWRPHPLHVHPQALLPPQLPPFGGVGGSGPPGPHSLPCFPAHGGAAGLVVGGGEAARWEELGCYCCCFVVVCFADAFGAFACRCGLHVFWRSAGLVGCWASATVCFGGRGFTPFHFHITTAGTPWLHLST